MKSLIVRFWFALKCKVLGDRLEINGWTQGEYTEIQEHIINVLMPNRLDEILEFGCGSGLHLCKISDLCKKIVGIDNSKPMLARSRNNCKNFNSEIIYCKSLKLGFQENKFEKVFSWSVFQYLENITEAKNLLREIYRIVKPDGLIFIGDLPNAMERKGYLKTPNKIKRFSLSAYLITICEYLGYLFFDPFLLKDFCEKNFGETKVIQHGKLLKSNNRFDILIKVQK